MTLAIVFAATLCGLALLCQLASIPVVLRRLQRAAAMPARDFRTQAVTLIRPVCGLENFIEETLASTFRLNHSNLEIIFCVAHPDDAAIPLVRRLIAAHPRVDSKLLIGPSCMSANPKLNNMAKGWEAAAHGWVLMVDSNVLMAPDTVERMFEAWTPDAGLVCSPPVGACPLSWAAEVECAVLNTYQARWQCVADSAGYGFAQGKAMLWRREFLERHGGMKALGHEPAEDAAATKLVRAAGLHVRLVAEPFVQPLGRRSARDVWKRQVRWGRLRRDTFPVEFAMELLARPIQPLAAQAILVATLDWPAVPTFALFLTLWYGAEVIVARAAGWHLRPRSLAAWIQRDLMMPAVWVASCAGDEFEWRGNAMTVADQDAPAR